MASISLEYVQATWKESPFDRRFSTLTVMA